MTGILTSGKVFHVLLHGWAMQTNESKRKMPYPFRYIPRGRKACLWAWLLQKLVGLCPLQLSPGKCCVGTMYKRATSCNWSLGSLPSLCFGTAQRNVRAVLLHPRCVTVSECWGMGGTPKSQSSSLALAKGPTVGQGTQGRALVCY